MANIQGFECSVVEYLRIVPARERDMKCPARNTRLKQEQSHLEAQIADGRPSGWEPVIEILSHHSWT